MKFKSLKVVLITCIIAIAQTSFAEMPKKELTPLEKKGLDLEADINYLFQTALKTAAFRLDKDGQVEPFAVIHRKSDNKIGVFGVDSEQKSLSVNDQNATIRNMLTKLAVNNQIKGSISVMFGQVRDKEAGTVSQGLVFEIEHEEGISLIRFIPVYEKENPVDRNKPRLVIELKAQTTNPKPAIVFAKSIVDAK
jgi:hypothetical protein